MCAVIGEARHSRGIYRINKRKGKAMNRNYLWLIVVVLLVGLVLTTMLATAQEVGSKIQWEYNITVTPQSATSQPYHEKTVGRLNELGEDGWELVGWEGRTWIFKRQSGN